MPHTPGPWKVRYYGKHTFDVVAQDARTLTDLMRRHDEREANARLIAAAPELLAACEDALEWSESRDGTEETDELCLRTIASRMRQVLSRTRREA